MLDWRFKNTSYVIGFYPSPETNDSNKYFIEQNFMALQWTYQVNIQMINHPDEMFDLHSLPYIAIQQKNKDTRPLSEFDHPAQAVYITGNSRYEFPMYPCKADMAVHIEVPDMLHPLYGAQAQAIVLNDRYIKNGTKL